MRSQTEIVLLAAARRETPEPQRVGAWTLDPAPDNQAALSLTADGEQDGRPVVTARGAAYASFTLSWTGDGR